MQQNRQDFILKTLNDALRADDRFDVVLTWAESTAIKTDRVTVYLYILEERALTIDEYEDLTVDGNRVMLTRLGIKYSFGTKRDFANASMTAIYTDTVARIEYLLRSLDLAANTTDKYGATISVKSAVLEQSFGYYDDQRPSGDSAGIIAVTSITTA